MGLFGLGKKEETTIPIRSNDDIKRIEPKIVELIVGVMTILRQDAIQEGRPFTKETDEAFKDELYTSIVNMMRGRGEWYAAKAQMLKQWNITEQQLARGKR